MSLKSRPSGAFGTLNRDEYAAQFRRHCHQLIAFGYGAIRAESHSGSEEDLITQRLREAIGTGRRDGILPRWADRYFVRDQVLVDVPDVAGKKRPKIDIYFESNESRRRPVYHFEAKRLRTTDTHSVSEYVGTGGLGMFLAELVWPHGQRRRNAGLRPIGIVDALGRENWQQTPA